MQISELIKLAKSSGSSSSLRSGSGSRIIIKFDINNIRNRCSSMVPPSPPPARSPRLDSLLINKRRLPWQKFRDGPRCLKILRHLSSRAKVKVSHRRSRTWSANLQIFRSGYPHTQLLNGAVAVAGAARKTYVLEPNWMADRSLASARELQQRECCVI
ncbi:LOW QUALITY PROTEIN: uncharacterized protein LOC122614512 [Drosophila teissieri]|uniref:LOW QUALITY PROTEIN: uncharacterized protein LOC122614512 n=1 Tax=Drosophila teissieri TaxID=7243 RepID=UPI001CBA2310|nr:LOW QUALITY PROTEIN: uncharacterized protein LOC122614512 [Drosophila teissieri]